jgi:hypothetical protein
MQVECHRAWADAQEYDKACGLDGAHPNCVCEIHSLRAQGGDGVSNSEILARVFTSPGSYDDSTSTIISGKITNVYGPGLSTIRQGASDLEISDTINTLLSGGQEAQSLVGASVFEASVIREFSDPDRCFGVYATDDGNKEHHVDILGTCPVVSASQFKKLKSIRRNELRKMLEQSLIRESDPTKLLAELRIRGI